MKQLKYYFLICCLVVASVVNAQGITSVSGTISDSFGPVVGAAIVEMDASNRNISATVTDFTGNFCGCFYGSAFFNCSYQAVVWSLSLLFMNTVYFFVLICMTSDCSSHTYIRHFPDSAPSNFPSNCFSSAEPLVLLKCSFGSPFFNNFTDFISSFSPYWCNRM